MLVTIAQIIGIFAAIIGGLWALTRYIIERGILPPTEFSISLNPKGIQKGELILEVILHLKNLGSSALVVQSLWVDVRYLRQDDKVSFINNTEARHLSGLTDFPHSVKKRLSEPAVMEARREALDLWFKERKKLGEERHREPRGLPLLPYKTFVQPGVKQKYTYITNIEEDTSFVLINAEFYYEPRPSTLQSIILFVSKILGLINYSLSHVRKPHTCQRVFEIDLTKANSDAD